jgi:hypothetical protein
MQTKVYPGGKGGAKSRYIGGILTFNSQVLFPGQVACKRVRATTAQVNAGYELLPAIPGHKYRIVDCDMIAIGGAAATATSVDLVATQGAAAIRPVVNAVAALTQSARVSMGEAPAAGTSVILADGASFAALDANTGVSVAKQSGGSNLGTATHIDVLLSYTIEVA